MAAETAAAASEPATVTETAPVQVVPEPSKLIDLLKESLDPQKPKRRTTKRRNTETIEDEPLEELPIKKPAPSAEQNSKRRRKECPLISKESNDESALVECVEVTSIDAKTESSKKSRSTTKKGKEPIVSKAEAQSVKTSRSKKIVHPEDEEILNGEQEGDEQVFKKPLRSALKSKDAREPNDKPETAKKISFDKEESIQERKPEKVVILTSNINEKQLKTVFKFQKQFSCKLLNQYDDSVTHFITSINEDKLSGRTVKYLMALLGHKYLLSFEWIESCLNAKKLVPEEEFEIKGTNKQSKSSLGAPRLSRTTKPKIFEKYHFLLDGKFLTEGFPSKDDFKRMIVMGGGDLITNQTQLKSVLKEQPDQVCYVIDPQNTHSKFWSNPNHILATDLLNVIMELKFKKH